MVLSEATISAVAVFIERGISMARKSRKHQHIDWINPPATDVVGYIRLSVANRKKSYSIQNQKFAIECWSDQYQIPVSRYYVDNGFSGKQLGLPAPQNMIQDILAGIINCVIVKNLSWLERDHITTGYYMEVLFQPTGSDLYW